MSQAITVTTKGRAAKRGRFVMAPASVVKVGDPDNPERVGVGVIPGKDGEDALVYEFGAAQTAIPFYAACSAFASGKTIGFDALMDAFEETGQLAALKKAVLKRLPDAPAPK